KVPAEVQAPRQRDAARREERDRQPDAGERDIQDAERAGVVVRDVHQPENNREDERRRPRSQDVGEPAQRKSAAYELLPQRRTEQAEREGRGSTKIRRP